MAEPRMDVSTMLEVAVSLVTLVGVFVLLGKWAEKRDNVINRVTALEEWKAELEQTFSDFKTKNELFGAELKHIQAKQEEMHNDIKEIGKMCLVRHFPPLPKGAIALQHDED